MTLTETLNKFAMYETGLDYILGKGNEGMYQNKVLGVTKIVAGLVELGFLYHGINNAVSGQSGEAWMSIAGIAILEGLKYALQRFDLKDRSKTLSILEEVTGDSHLADL